MDEQIYDYDDFFVPDADEGETVWVPIRGRQVPIKLKRGLTLGDVKAAQSKAVIQKVDPRGGIQIVGIDEDKFTTELMLTAIVSWPFKRNVGSREEPRWVDVPVSKENLKAMLAEGAAFIEKHLTSKIQGAEAVASPLERASGAAS